MTNLKNTALDPHRGKHGPPWLMARLARKMGRLLTRTAQPQKAPGPEEKGIPGNRTAGTEREPGPFDGWTVITGAKREKTGRS